MRELERLQKAEEQFCAQNETLVGYLAQLREKLEVQFNEQESRLEEIEAYLEEQRLSGEDLGAWELEKQKLEKQHGDLKGELEGLQEYWQDLDAS